MDQFVGDLEFTEILTNAPGNPFIWDKFLSRLATLTACDSSYILVTNLIHRENTRFLFSFNITEKLQALYTNKLNKLDSFNYLLSKYPQQIFCSQEYKAKVANNCSTDSSLHYRMGFSIPCNTGHTINLCVNRKHTFSQKEQHLVKQLLKSIITPLENAIQKEQQQKIYSQIIHHVHDNIDGFIIIDRSLNILFSDSIFLSAIDNFNGVNIKDNFIEFKTSEDQQRLSFLMSNNKMASIHSQCSFCQITLIPITSLDNLYYWECYQDSFILALSHDKKHKPMVDRLINIHKLSRCEALCALNFMQTPSITEIAEYGCRSQNTIRNHIKRIMQKMEVHNQAALMKKLMSLASL